MPRIPYDNNHPAQNQPRATDLNTTIRSTELTCPKKPGHRGETAVYLQDTDVDLKLKILADSIAKEYLALDFSKNGDIKDISVDDLSNTAYIFVDNDGKPTKILAPSVLRKEITWDDLADSTKQKIQAAIDAVKLTAGRNIVIDSDNKINANIGVETVNGKTGDVSLTASDIPGVPTKVSQLENDTGYLTAADLSNYVTDDELAAALNSIEIDGGRI